VEPPGEPAASAGRQAVAGEARPAGASASTLPDGHAIRVTVLDSAGARPVAGFDVALHQGRRAAVVRTGADGTALTEPVFRPGADPVYVEETLDQLLEGDPHPRTWRVEPSAFLVERTPERRVELELTATPPSLVLEVVLTSVPPAADAPPAVEMQLGERFGEGPFRARGRNLTGELDGAGRARFSLLDEEPQRQSVAFSLIDAPEGWVSDPLVLDPPIGPGPWSLQVYRGGTLTVRVTGGGGEGVTGVTVIAIATETAVAAREDETDAQGRALFASMRAGEQWLIVRDARSTEPLADRKVRMPRGADLEVELPLAAVEPALAVAGRLLSEDGEGLEGVHVRVIQPGEERGSYVETDASGRFELWTNQHPAVLRVRPGGSVFADVYEPEQIVAPFGATDLEFRRVESVPVRRVTFRLVDAPSGELLSDERTALVSVWRSVGPGRVPEDVAHFDPTSGIAQVDFRPVGELRWAVAVEGYQHAEGGFETALAAHEPLVEVRLRPGFLRELDVVRSSDGAGLAGVRFVDETGRVIGTTDSLGHVVLAAPEWPSELSLRLDDHELATWEPTAYARLWLGTISIDE
jgi:hypothetical protein